MDLPPNMYPFISTTTKKPQISQEMKAKPTYKLSLKQMSYFLMEVINQDIYVLG
jgi:hypothetical protein